MAAPALRDAVIAAVQVFDLIARNGTGPAVLAAGDMLPMLQGALAAAGVDAGRILEQTEDCLGEN